MYKTTSTRLYCPGIPKSGIIKNKPVFKNESAPLMVQTADSKGT